MSGNFMHAKNRFIASFAAIAACLFMGCSNSADFETARQRLLDMAKEVELISEALAAGDQEQARVHQAEATRLLRAARYIYESNGAEQSDDPVVLVGYADVLRQSGDFDVAAEMYAKATEHFTDDASLWLNLGKALAAQDERAFPRAQAALERAAELTTDDNLKAEAFSELATLYRRMGLYEFAADNLEQTLELRPSDQNARIVLAAHQARRGRVQEASETLDAFTQLTADAALQMRDALGSALADFETYRHIFADTAENHLAYAKLLLRVERTSEAVPAIERSVRLSPGDYIAWNLLGSVSRQLGNTDRAREAFERSLALNPDQPRTAQALKDLAPDTSPEINFLDQVTPQPQP